MSAFDWQLRIVATWAGLLLVVFAAANAWGVDIYVSTKGDDSWSGHARERFGDGTNGPFATLNRARDEIRRSKNTGNPNEPVIVWIESGTYYLTNGFDLESRDSGTEAKPVEYRGHGNEKPLLTGGKPVTNFVAYSGQILRADVGSQGLKGIYFRQLLYNHKRQPLARYPNFDDKNPCYGGWAYADGKWVSYGKTIPGEDKHSFTYKHQDERAWSHAKGAEIFVFPRYNWWNNIVPVASVDATSRRVTLAKDCSYAIRPGDRYYVQNVFEELDAPGEWYLDKQTWTLYFWPPGSLETNQVSVPMARHIFKLDSVSNLKIKGLAFECCEGSAVEMETATNCIVEDCVIHDVGDYQHSGVVVQGGHGDSVLSCEISRIGAHAIFLSGGIQKTLTSSSHCAENNVISLTGLDYKQGVGIELSGVGNRASHNLIYDTPRMGILFWGNNHLIEFNDVHHVNLETQDSGIVYTSARGWIGGRGCVVRYNFFHDSIGYGQNDKGKWESPHNTVGIYLDDNAAGVDVIGNIVARCPNSLINVHNGRDNLIDNNILLDGGNEQVRYTGWTATSFEWTNFFPEMIRGYESVALEPAWRGLRGMSLHPTNAVRADKTVMSGNVFCRNILSYSGSVATLWRLSDVSFDCNISDSNLVWHFEKSQIGVNGPKGKPASLEWKAWQKMGFDQHSLIADPQFMNATNDDYRLEPGSPAFILGFRPIPVEKIGLYPNRLRQSVIVR